MNKRHFLTLGLAATLGLITGTGCALLRGEMDQGDVALLALDLQDIAREGTIYALAKEPQWRPNIELVRNQLATLAALPDQPTPAAVLKVLQTLPFDEFQTPEARLSFVGANWILRRVGRNVDLGNIVNIKPIVNGLATGITEGLNMPIVSQWSPVPPASSSVEQINYEVADLQLREILRSHPPVELIAR